MSMVALSRVIYDDGKSQESTAKAGSERGERSNIDRTAVTATLEIDIPSREEMCDAQEDDSLMECMVRFLCGTDRRLP
jgi:hypothetical protein